jgi:hypothetical protein
MEYWVGWFDKWGYQHAVRPAKGKCIAVCVAGWRCPCSWIITQFSAH